MGGVKAPRRACVHLHGFTAAAQASSSCRSRSVAQAQQLWPASSPPAWRTGSSWTSERACVTSVGHPGRSWGWGAVEEEQLEWMTRPRMWAWEDGMS